MEIGAQQREARAVAQYVKQLRNRCSFNVTGNQYLCEGLWNRTARTAPTVDDKFAVGPIVIAIVSASSRKLCLPRSMRSYSDDKRFMAALIGAGVEDMKFFKSPEARMHGDFNEDATEGAHMSWRKR